MTAINLADARPGDIVAFETGGIFGRLIQLGQWLRRSDRRYRRFHHIAVIVDYDGCGNEGRASPHNWLCVQAARHVDIASLGQAASRGCPFTVFACPPDVDRSLVIAQARALVGIEYGVLTIVSIGVDILTPRSLRVSFRAGGDPTLICSALGALCLHAGGWLHEWQDIYQVTPADLVGALSIAA